MFRIENVLFVQLGENEVTDTPLPNLWCTNGCTKPLDSCLIIVQQKLYSLWLWKYLIKESGSTSHHEISWLFDLFLWIFEIQSSDLAPCICHREQLPSFIQTTKRQNPENHHWNIHLSFHSKHSGRKNFCMNLWWNRIKNINWNSCGNLSKSQKSYGRTTC